MTAIWTCTHRSRENGIAMAWVRLAGLLNRALVIRTPERTAARSDDPILSQRRFVAFKRRYPAAERLSAALVGPPRNRSREEGTCPLHEGPVDLVGNAVMPLELPMVPPSLTYATPNSVGS
jgi:hypothetical protein